MSNVYRTILVGALMVLASVLAVAAKPRTVEGGAKTSIDLEKVVPKAFGEWREDTSISPITLSPDVKASLAKVYSQTLSRAYINAQGERLMLSIAYGDTQSRNLQVHRPEVCYGAQGFRISALLKDELWTGQAKIPVMKLVASLGLRQEPITYWVRFGDKVVRGNIEQGLARLVYGLQGTVPDGLLFRVSSIGSLPAHEYEVQQRFVADLMATLSPEGRAALVGTNG